MSLDTPGPYGWNPTPEHRARVQAEIARQREQAARRRAECSATYRNPDTEILRCARTQAHRVHRAFDAGGHLVEWREAGR